MRKDFLMLTILSPEPRTGLARLVIFVEGINECKMQCHFKKWLPCHTWQFFCPLRRQWELQGLVILSSRGSPWVLP